MGGIIGLGGTAPQPTIVPIDAGTNSLIDTAVARGQQTPDQFAAAQNEGVSEGANQANQSQDQANQEDATRGYSSGSLNQAIRNQYQQQSGNAVNNLKNTYSQNAVFTKSAALQQAAAESMARQNVTTQSYATLMNAYNQTEMARAQTLNSILGAGGMMAGAAAAHKNKSPGGYQGSISSMPGQTMSGSDSMDMEGQA